MIDVPNIEPKNVKPGDNIAEVTIPHFWQDTESTKPGDKTHDPVNNPSHYTQGDIECIDAIRASMTDEEFAGFLKGNAMKYLWRYRKKGNPVQDLKKAEWYTTKLESFYIEASTHVHVYR